MNRTTKVASTLLLLAVASAAKPQTEPLGRLFFTPEQRAELDRFRQSGQIGSSLDNGNPITLNGRVTRSSGRNTAWINGVPLDDHEARTLLTPVQLRPGETSAGLSNGERTDVLNGGAIQINRDTASNSR